MFKAMPGLKSRFKEGFPDLVRIGRLVKYEADAFRATAFGALSLSRRRKLGAVRSGDHLKLHLASGPAPRAGWLNLDVATSADVRIDLRRRFPLPDGCAALLFSEHFCDHVEYPHVIGRVLAECHRLLEPGGVARFVLHDAKELCAAYANDDPEYFVRGEYDGMRPIEAVNELFRFNDFHQFLYDFDLFRDLLLAAGFSAVTRCKFKESSRIELLLDFDLESRDALSMYVEAMK